LRKLFTEDRSVAAMLTVAGWLGSVVWLVCLLSLPVRDTAANTATESTGAAAVSPSDDDLLILEIRLGEVVLSEAVTAYQVKDGICILLADVISALDFPIEIDAETGVAEGWFLSEDRHFRFDPKHNRITFGSEPPRAALTGWHDFPDGSCIETGVLAIWFPVDFSIDLAHSMIGLTSREPLPIEREAERQKKQASLQHNKPGDPAGLERLPTDYRVWDWPVAELFSETRIRENGKDTDQPSQSRFNMIAIGDLGHMSAVTNMFGDTQEGVTAMRLRLQRIDPDGALLGPLGATELSFGDVATTRSPLLAQSTVGRGALVSSFPVERPDAFDRTTFRGPLPIGWEVELYRNTALVAFQRSGDNGRYEFVDVPVLFGENRFRFEFYGPQGQRRSQEKVVNVSAELVPKGQHFFRFVINQQDRDLIEVGEDGSDDPDRGKVRFSTALRFGLTDDFSLGGEVARYTLDGEERVNAALDIHAAWAGAAWRGDFAVDERGGSAMELSVQRAFGSVSTLARYGRYFNYESEIIDAPDGDNLLQKIDARADAILRPWDGVILPLTIDGAYLERESGRQEINLTEALSVDVENVSVSNIVTAALVRNESARTADVISGTLLINRRLDNVFIRGEFNYDLSPKTEGTELVLSGDVPLADLAILQTELSRDMIENRTTVTAGFSRQFEKFAVGADISGDNDGNAELIVSVSTSLGRNPLSGRLHASASGLSSGAVAARVFIDENRNRRFDDGEKPVPGVGLLAGHQPVATRSDAGGTVVVTNLPKYQDVSIIVDRGTIEDPYLSPALPGMRVAARPGLIVGADIPLVPTGEVDGTVRLMRGDVWEEAGDVSIELVDEQGTVAHRTKSEFDGFFLFDSVPIGRYHVRVSPAQLTRLELLSEAESGATLDTGSVPGSMTAVELTIEEPVVSNVDFLLRNTAPNGPTLVTRPPSEIGKKKPATRAGESNREASRLGDVNGFPGTGGQSRNPLPTKAADNR